MKNPKDLIGHLSGGRVLDIATGGGGFIHFLLDGLKDYTEIIGIDTNDRSSVFMDTFKEKPAIRFEKMDGLHLTFDDNSFDTVTIANSLHHFDEPQVVLEQMFRVLRPGGHLILNEMYCDNQTETQMSHVLLHHWWAEIDQLNGVTHHKTYPREEMISMIKNFKLTELMVDDLSDLTEDPKNSEIMLEIEPVISRYIQRAEGHPILQARGEELRQRINEIGFHGASSLFILGTKPELSQDGNQ